MGRAIPAVQGARAAAPAARARSAKSASYRPVIRTTGSFEAAFWRLHSGFDPDLQNVWWNSLFALDYGEVTVNFARLRDPVVDEALGVIRTSPDEDDRRRAAEQINRRFAEQVYNLWLGWAITGIIFDPAVRDVHTGFTTVGGAPVLPTGVGIGGTHQLAQIWIEPGS